MAKRKTRKRKSNDSFIDLIIEADWKLASLFAFFILFMHLAVVPILNNSTLNLLNQSVKPIVYFIVGLLLVTSIVKYFLASSKTNKPEEIFQNKSSPSSYVNKRIEPKIYSSPQSFVMEQAQQRPNEWTLNLLQEIEWKRFEDLSTAYYLEKGIKAKATSLGADGGIDIKLFQDDTNNPTSLVQCKSWGKRQVGVKEIREFLGVLTHEKVGKGFFMTTGDFTDDAKETAKLNKINLITGQMFLSMIMKLPEESQQKLLALATEGDYKTPSCSACGIKMVSKYWLL